MIVPEGRVASLDTSKMRLSYIMRATRLYSTASRHTNKVTRYLSGLIHFLVDALLVYSKVKLVTIELRGVL